MNIKFISFQSINNNIPTGMVKFMLPILNKMNLLSNSVYFISSCKNYNGPINIKEIGVAFKIVSKLSQIFRKVFSDVSSGKIRLFQEMFFDYFTSFKIKEASILVSTAYLKTTTSKNTRLGGINIFIAGNPDDREIYKIMQEEQNKYNIKIHDAYTYRKRIDFISNSLNSYDHIITSTSSELETYSKYITNNRYSFIEAFIVPNHNTFKSKKVQKNEKLTFCYIAHTVWLKGLIYLVESFNKLHSNEVQLFIGGSINKQIQNTIDKMDLNQNIKFVGHVPDLNKYMRSSHVCVVPSLLDAGPATVAEALYCGLPVITTDGCGSKTLIKDGENGFVVPIANSDALAEKIQWFIDNQDKIEQMGKNAKETMLNVEHSDQNEVLANHIKEVMDKLKKEKGIV
jgi:glycosyltransferase involved in cell wall biosynthesis